MCSFEEVSCFTEEEIQAQNDYVTQNYNFGVQV